MNSRDRRFYLMANYGNCMVQAGVEAAGAMDVSKAAEP